MPKIPLEAPSGFTLQVGIPISHLREVEFHYILGQLTVAEESAIRQITPLISIIRLKRGNVGRKGVVSCVQQSSNLNKILPNLPQQCKFLVFQRTQGDGSMKSFTVFFLKSKHLPMSCARCMNDWHDAMSSCVTSSRHGRQCTSFTCFLRFVSHRNLSVSFEIRSNGLAIVAVLSFVGVVVVHDR
jgi:hypothetical protein